MMFGLAVRLVAATAAVLLAAHCFSHDVVRWMLPMLSGALDIVAGDFKILSVELMVERQSDAIGALATLRHAIFLGGRAIVPDDSQVLMAGATVGTVLQPILMALVLALAWPAQRLELLVRVLIVSALLPAIVLLDTPFSLAAWLWRSQLRLYEPDRGSLLLAWSTFLNGGGRLVLGLIAGALSIALAQRVLWRLKPGAIHPRG